MQPIGETRRLALLRSLDILDTPAEDCYDRMTRLLCRILDMPMAGLTLVDEDRSWFKSGRGGLNGELGRSDSFCSHTILQDTPTVVYDARLSEQFQQLSMVQGEPHVVFYAGCPIKLGQGLNVGTLCVFDTKPRELSSEDIQFLEDVCQTAANEMRAKLFKDIYGTKILAGQGHD